MINDKLLATLTGCYRLAQQATTEYERDVATSKFHAILEKNGLTEADYHATMKIEATEFYDIRWTDKRDKELIIQILRSIYRQRDIETYKRSGQRKCVIAKLTRGQYALLTVMLATYREAWEKELESVMHAFCLKHNLQSGEQSSSETVDQEEWERVAALAQGLRDVTDPRTPKLPATVEA